MKDRYCAKLNVPRILGDVGDFLKTRQGQSGREDHQCGLVDMCGQQLT
jgi:hypothetical protein